MATWNDLRQHVQTRYHVGYVTEHGQLCLRFDLPHGRRQTVMVSPAIDGSNGDEWAKIESTIARVDEVDLHALLELIRFQLVGGLAKNDDFVTVRHSIPLADMSVEEFESPLAAVLETADYLELSITGVDRY